jgi:protein SCO1/2
MKAMTRRTWFAAAGALGTGAGLAAAFDGWEASADENSPRERIRQQYFPNVLLTTQEGRQVRFYDDLLKDKIVLLNFMYTLCSDGTCPIVTHNLVQVQRLLGKRMGRDVFFISLSLKPEQDTPIVLKAYAKAHGVGPGWAFVTGKPEDMELLRRRLGFTDPNPERDADANNHTGMIRYGNEPRHIWAGAPGEADPAFIAQMIGWVDWPAKKQLRG